jgi:hypothetical protein
MVKVIVQFEKCIQNIQELSQDDEFMFSRIFLTLVYPDGKSKSMSVDIKQTSGSNYTEDPLEVFLPKERDLHINYNQFRDVVERYFRTLVGANARGINFQAGSSIKMYNNTFNMPAKYEIDYVTDKEVGW